MIESQGKPSPEPKKAHRGKLIFQVQNSRKAVLLVICLLEICPVLTQTSQRRPLMRLEHEVASVTSMKTVDFMLVFYQYLQECAQKAKAVSSAEASKLQTMGHTGMSACFLSKVQFEHRHTHLFMYHLCLLSCYVSRIEELQQRLYKHRI